MSTKYGRDVFKNWILENTIIMSGKKIAAMLVQAKAEENLRFKIACSAAYANTADVLIIESKK